MTISWPEAWHIDHLKITGYLLNVAHKDGGPKARAFFGYGFDVAKPHQLALALLDQAASSVPRVVEGGHGVRYVLEGSMEAPNGSIPRVRSVWLIRSNETSARLVTPYLSTSAGEHMTCLPATTR